MSLVDLGRRAVACKHWEWLPGMVLRSKTKSGMQYYGRVCYLEEDDLYCDGRDDRFGPEDLKGAYPDLEDPATIGCLLALVREAWGSDSDEWQQFMVPIWDGFSNWRVGCLRLTRLPSTPCMIVPVDKETMEPLLWAYSEAEALVIALEAAP